MMIDVKMAHHVIFDKPKVVKLSLVVNSSHMMRGPSQWDDIGFKNMKFS
jgi:hypothetical protein